MPVLTTLTSLIGLIVAIAGIAVSAMHVGRVRGAGLLLAGFCLQAFAGIVFRLTTWVVPHMSSSVYVPHALGSVVGVTGSALVVAGLYTVLAGRAASAPASDRQSR